MILFNKKCEICGKPTSGQHINEIDNHIICIHHFRMLLEAGLLFEGMDDKWHFMFVCEEDIKEFIKML